MYLWRNGYVQKSEKCTAVASKVAGSLAHPSYAEQHGVACSPMNKSGQPSGSLCFFSLLWGTERFRGVRSVCTVVPYFSSSLDAEHFLWTSFYLIAPSAKWAPYTLLYRDVNTSAAEVAEVPSEREVNCDAFAELYRVGGWTFGCKNEPKKRIKGALFTDCFVVDNSFWVK